MLTGYLLDVTTHTTHIKGHKEALGCVEYVFYLYYADTTDVAYVQVHQFIQVWYIQFFVDQLSRLLKMKKKE